MPGYAVRGWRRRRTAAAAPSASAIATSTRIKGSKSENGLAAADRVVPPACIAAVRLRVGVAAGRRSSRAFPPLDCRRRTSARGKEVDRARVPTPGGLAPAAPGTFSQYWLIALTDGGPLQYAPTRAACAGAATAASATNTNTRVNLTMAVSGARC